jgi:archaellum component FlaC
MAVLRKGSLLGICVHHSVYKPANNMAELKAQASLFNTWHKKKSWAEATKGTGNYPYISYHYLIATNGDLLKVTYEKYVKYHAGDNFREDLSFNLHGLGVCLTGNYETDKPTEAQMRTLVNLIRDVEKRYGINARIRGHKETSQTATACPGKNIGTSKSGWLKQVIANVNDKNYPPVEAPTPPPVETECEKQLNILKGENTTLKTELTASKVALEKSVDDLRVCNADLEECKEELGKYDDRITELEKNVRDLTSQKAEAVKQLNEWKENALKEAVKYVVQKVVDFIKNLPKKK